MPDLPAAHISHFTARRLRIKVPEKRRNRAFFETVADRLSSWDSVERAETNPLTGSVLIYFSDPQRLFLEAVAKNDLFDIDLETAFSSPSEPVVTPAAARSFETVDRTLRHWTQNQIDVRGVLFVLLVAGGVFQLLRRRLDTPAPTLLWYAGDLIGLWSGRGPEPAVAAASGPDP
jgi:heavy-metal-associated domain-containing protein